MGVSLDKNSGFCEKSDISSERKDVLDFFLFDQVFVFKLELQMSAVMIVSTNVFKVNTVFVSFVFLNMKRNHPLDFFFLT